MRESLVYKLAVCDGCGCQLAIPTTCRIPDICPRCGFAERVGGKARVDAGVESSNVIDVPFSVVAESSPSSKQEWIPVVSEKEAKKAAKKAEKEKKKKK